MLPGGGVDIESEESGRVELAEAAEDGGVRSKAVPALTDQRRMDEAGGEAEADNDLDEQVVVIEDLGFRVGCRCYRTR
jgi:hypothetical protein